MNRQRKKTAAARVALSVLLVLSLLVFAGSFAAFQMFSPARLDARLHHNGFYRFASTQVTGEIEALESVVGLETKAVMEVLNPAEVESALSDYVHALNAHFLTGGQAPDSIAYTSDTLYQLVCSTITPDHYDGNTDLMEQDRTDAYAEITDAVGETLTFFPAALIQPLLSHFLSQRMYRLIGLAAKCWIPALALGILCLVGLFLLQRNDPLAALRRIGGIWFVTGSALFLPAAFLHSYSLLNRLSLSDGLLRRYILSLYGHWSDTLFWLTLTVFLIGAVMLIAAILLSAKAQTDAATHAIEAYPLNQ